MALFILLCGRAVGAAPPKRVLQSLDACFSGAKNPVRLKPAQQAALLQWLRSPDINRERLEESAACYYFACFGPRRSEWTQRMIKVGWQTVDTAVMLPGAALTLYNTRRDPDAFSFLMVANGDTAVGDALDEARRILWLRYPKETARYLRRLYPDLNIAALEAMPQTRRPVSLCTLVMAMGYFEGGPESKVQFEREFRAQTSKLPPADRDYLRNLKRQLLQLYHLWYSDR
jgi:hypothetical protein